MGSHGGMQTQSQEQNPNAFTRQGSLYSLTLDEVQNQLRDLGKPLTSMNIDELVKTVCTVESNQGMSGIDYGVSAERVPVASGSSVRRESSITMSRDLSKKTVDEVWRDIQHGQKRSNLDRQPTFGEITLEDFLVKAGVVAESVMAKRNSAPVLMVDQQQAQWTPYQIPSVHQPQEQHQQQNMVPVFMPGHPVQPAIPIGPTPIMDGAFPESQLTISPSALVGTLSDTQTPGRKRVAPGDVVERSVERRQKRMIKNRESAARSRARKQAYTNELENKISRLEEENERLKRQKEIEKLLPSVAPPEPKHQLRRTSSAPI